MSQHSPTSRKPAPQPPSASNFIRTAIEQDLATGKYATRTWAGRPGPAALQAGAPRDPARIRTRFPPEPNGYLHIGHAKSICLNFGLAHDYGGACHMRFDDTNPEKEEQQYVDSILDAVQWLGFDWGPHLYYASDYFDFMYRAAEHLVERGLAYVDEQSAEEMRAARGTLAEPGRNSPWRERPAAESLKRLREMRDGRHAEGSMVLRAKIDMGSPNLNLRDPVIYRIRKAVHHRTGERWCIYPLYAYAHPIEDALENITHSLCTLEFEDQRPFYDWLLDRLAEGGLLLRPLPQQIEFARLNLSYVVLSKRRLIELVEQGHVEGWDDPRMPTLAGARRRGYTPEGFRRFAERIGVAKADSWIDYSVLEECMREELNEMAERRIAVLDPIRLVIDNYPVDGEEQCEAPNHPQKPELGRRPLPFSRELWIEREDFMEHPQPGYFRLFPGNRVRLRYAYVVTCTGCEKDAHGNVVAVHCTYDPATRSGTPGAEKTRIKGNIHWLSARHAVSAEVRLYDRLFSVPHPGTERDYREDFDPGSKKIVAAKVERALAQAQPEARFQFERQGYFVADRRDSRPGRSVFNRTVSLRDSWVSRAR
ncbi:MAG TPA: glutamine--tRNA ligase/YqeY domain fusion protein [Burkholderiales bacterium]|nr:glutamine--tRNA ligase/YqeY domain fusion protein [Burkholderiales bacterium]